MVIQGVAVKRNILKTRFFDISLKLIIKIKVRTVFLNNKKKKKPTICFKTNKRLYFARNLTAGKSLKTTI